MSRRKAAVSIRNEISYIVLFFILIVVFCSVILSPIFAHASPSEPVDYEILDWFAAVDHPPFQQDYPGDGYSFLNVGLTVPLQEFEGTSVFGMLVGNNRTVEETDEIDAYGRALLSFPLYGYGEYQFVITDEDGQFIFEQAVVVNAQEQAYNMEQLAKSPPREVEVTPEPTVNTGPEPEIEPEVEPEIEPEVEPEVDEESKPETELGETDNIFEGDWKWLPLIGLGLIVGTIGLFFARKRNCEEERLAWMVAEGLRRKTRSEADQARADAEEAAAVRSGLDEALAEIREAYPSAGKPGGEEAWIESDGRRITSRDVAMRREAEQAAHQKYQDNPTPETAKKLEEEWRDAASPESEAKRREAKESADDIAQRRDEAQEAEQNALRSADAAEQAAGRAADAADAARRAFEECMGKSNTGTADGDSHGGKEAGPCTTCGGAATTTGSGEGTQPRTGGCREGEPPQERNVRELGRVILPVRLHVEIRGGHAHAAAIVGKEISDELSDISEELGWISSAMDLKGIGSALVRDRSGWKMLGESVAPGIGKLTGTPIPTSPGQAAVDYLSIAAKIASVIVEKVPELQSRRLPDCDINIAVVNRTMRATCTEVWVCQNGQWVQDGTKFTLTVESERRSGIKRYEAYTWAQAQTLIEEWEDIQMRRLQRALDELTSMEARCGS